MLNKKRATINAEFFSPFERGRLRGGIWVACFILLIFSANSVFASAITADRIFELTNQSRATENVPALEISSELQSAAKAKADDMLLYDYFAHTSPEGIEPWHWISQVGYNYEYAGENLAMDFLTSEGVHRGLIGSATHKANIINSNYKEIGIAVVSGEFEGRTATIIVEMFGSRLFAKEAKILPEPGKIEEHSQEPVVLSSVQNIAKDSPSSSAGRPISDSDLAMVEIENLNRRRHTDVSLSKEEKETTLVYAPIDDLENLDSSAEEKNIEENEKISQFVFQKFGNNSEEFLLELGKEGLPKAEIISAAQDSAKQNNRNSAVNNIIQSSMEFNLSFSFLFAYVWTALCALFEGVIREV